MLAHAASNAAASDQANAANMECVRTDFNSKCQVAKVHMKGLIAGATKKKVNAKIGLSDHLSVGLGGAIRQRTA